MFISEKKPSVFSATTSKKQSLKSKLQQENRNGNIESSKSRSRKRSGSFESSMKKPSANSMSLKAQLEQEKQRSRKSSVESRKQAISPYVAVSALEKHPFYSQLNSSKKSVD